MLSWVWYAQLIFCFLKGSSEMELSRYAVFYIEFILEIFGLFFCQKKNLLKSQIYVNVTLADTTVPCISKRIHLAIDWAVCQLQSSFDLTLYKWLQAAIFRTKNFWYKIFIAVVHVTKSQESNFDIVESPCLRSHLLSNGSKVSFSILI